MAAETVGVFGGSFNPPHPGHIAVARAVVDAGLADRVLLVLSPLNPLKADPAALAPDTCRMDMLRLAADGVPGVEASDIELSMPRPSYTIDTMRRLAALAPGTSFRLIIGGDNWDIFDRWKGSDELIARFPPIIYPRGDGKPVDPSSLPPGVDLLEHVPLLDVSSTAVRRAIAAGLPVNNLLPPGVYSYIARHGLYGCRDANV